MDRYADWHAKLCEDCTYCRSEQCRKYPPTIFVVVSSIRTYYPKCSIQAELASMPVQSSNTRIRDKRLSLHTITIL